MTFRVFELEQWQSDWEHTVEYNLADSSVRGIEIGFLLGADAWESFRRLELGYPMVNGTDLLRSRIAALYPGATDRNVLVTVGSAEANQLVCETLIGAGDQVAVMEPGYRQVYGLAEMAGAQVEPLRLDPERGWRPDLDRLEQSVSERTKLIAIVNPNNPTGSIMKSAEIERLIAIAARVGAWILADEVYCGAERSGDAETPSLWGRYDRVIAVNSLSKAYGMSGARIGWLVAPEAMIQDLWRRHEYAVIAAAAPSMRLAEIALDPINRARLIGRQRELTRQGWTVMERWLAAHPDLVSVGASEATSMAFVRYRLPQSSVTVADTIRREASVLVSPGEYLGADHHLRITHGLGQQYVETALGRVAEVLTRLRAGRPAAAAVSG